MKSEVTKYLNDMWHKAQHASGTNKGTIETWWEGEHLMVGFKCSCGEMQGVARTTIKRKQPSLLVEYHGEEGRKG